MIIDNLETMLEDAVCAPSGENCQPWRFVVYADHVRLYNDETADTSLYNVQQCGSYIAHGALLTNLSLSAKHYGYTLISTLFPDEDDTTYVARLFFEQGDKYTDPLYGAIRKRHTNRKDFLPLPLNDAEKDALIKSGENDVVCTIIDDQEAMASIGKALALHEKVLFENKAMHDFFYEHLLWKKEEEMLRPGFYYKTLEFLPHQLQAVKVLRYWPVLSFLNKVASVATKISQENGEKYAKKTGAFLMIAIHKHTKEEYVALGKALERILLTAETLSLSVHPCNGSLYLMDYIAKTAKHGFTKEHVASISDAYATLCQYSKVKASFILRIGKSDPPTDYALRMKPNIRYCD